MREDERLIPDSGIPETWSYLCERCGTLIPITPDRYLCDCGGMLWLDTRKDPHLVPFAPERIDQQVWSMFRYHRSMAVPGTWKAISLGEGRTPLIPLHIDRDDLSVKLEQLMPTASFKDRGAAVLISVAKALGVSQVVQDSSGNAGTAVAAYAARAGIACTVFVPEATSDAKVAQTMAHGAEVIKVPGPREESARAALERVQECAGKVFYASHVYNPFFYEGTKTFIYELFEQMGRLPDTLVLPVGNGTLVIGAYLACREMAESGLVGVMPRIIAVQASPCAPIAEAFSRDELQVTPVIGSATLAEGIAIGAPKRGDAILRMVRETGGEVITAPEDAIRSTMGELARRGLYVELTTAATFAGWAAYEDRGDHGMTVIPICGTGLKSH